jgi:hypothetical protein
MLKLTGKYRRRVFVTRLDELQYCLPQVFVFTKNAVSYFGNQHPLYLNQLAGRRGKSAVRWHALFGCFTREDSHHPLARIVPQPVLLIQA